MRFTKTYEREIRKRIPERYEKEFRERYDKDYQQQRQQHQQDAVAALKAEIERLRKLLAQQSS